MPPAEATELFQRVVGPREVVEPDACAQIVNACGYLPLAIRIAAARLRSRPAWTVGDLLARLTDSRRRLTELRAGDRAVGTAFDLSYRHLTEEQRALFRRLGLHTGVDVTVASAATLSGTDHATTEELLEQLLDVHLVQQHVAGRYRLHDLLRQFAAERAEEEEQPQDLDLGRQPGYLTTTRTPPPQRTPRSVPVPLRRRRTSRR